MTLTWHRYPFLIVELLSEDQGLGPYREVNSEETKENDY